jgi:enamine deaminase RidA (YjgF/YER057c/UK114 family)
MATISAALAKAGFSLQDVVRTTYYLTEAEYADVVLPIMGGYFADIRPACTVLVCGLVRPEMKVEIEITARRRR